MTALAFAAGLLSGLMLGGVLGILTMALAVSVGTVDQGDGL